jgi:hypothetical protein
MDPVSHYVVTRRLVGKERAVVLAGILSDAPFYLCYPARLVAQGKVRRSLENNIWPDPPQWLLAAHRITHSLPLLLVALFIYRLITGCWPLRPAAAWALHIAIDIPTHSRDPWGPRFLWPLSDFGMDGVSWVEVLVALRNLHRKKR